MRDDASRSSTSASQSPPGGVSGIRGETSLQQLRMQDPLRSTLVRLEIFWKLSHGPERCGSVAQGAAGRHSAIARDGLLNALQTSVLLRCGGLRRDSAIDLLCYGELASGPRQVLLDEPSTPQVPDSLLPNLRCPRPARMALPTQHIHRQPSQPVRPPTCTSTSWVRGTSRPTRGIVAV